ncbi:RNA methyltransferase, TrmH family group 3 [Gottschalkia acidurici 9a]|uniref:RNA methyltransferase, TrmH family group 3 n=1 Tax=Gottschalkia acidurici (strain ATCC 7906 / DSM 604 / BCRC 14475 / CIP 104303 / KCTC 5404 / NCIMB 10678 / 9a) TaxID=1128398 RepID=K0B3Y9_GOTA9|nr:23S rRNA (guanosine(2251)-2'-O)-methyltransferase RlmB [Gottschalkia acidurici]AFS79286.1 RNA methyltransferase, TrmH family group 3 [Gottschalkia acidurici 9a]
MEYENNIEGRNPVQEALKSGRNIEKILIAKGASEGSINKIIGMAKDRKIIIQYVERAKLDNMSDTKSHQGVIAIASAYSYKTVDDILSLAEGRNEDPFILILDEIEDPHNLGAIMRTAESAGVHGIIIPKRRSVGLTAIVSKTSAGAIEYIPVAKVSNISSTIEELKRKNIWIYGAHMEGNYYYEQDLKGPIALVIGSEGKGISRLVKEKCDFLIKIPMRGKVSSLNASVAASIITYEALRQRGV